MSLVSGEGKLRGQAIIDEQERWVTPLLNKLQVVSRDQKPKSVIIKDDTIRSGANTPGVYANNEGKKKIAEKLEEAGIKEIEAGLAGMKEHHQLMTMLRSTGSKLRISAHVGLMYADYKDRMCRAIEAGADAVELAGVMQGAADLPPSEEEEALKRALVRTQDAIRFSKEQGVFTAVMDHFPRLDWIVPEVKAIVEAGADRIGVADGRGWCTPDALSWLIRYVRDIAGEGVQIHAHFHNDFGLATINTMEAIKAGADSADVCVNGAGHRCGNAALEEVVTALEVLYDIRTGIDLSKIYSLCKLVEEIYGVRISPNRPHVGENMYAYSGYHISPILKGEWYENENVKAETIGCTRSIVWGATADPGRAGPIAAKVEQMGLTCTDKELYAIFEMLQRTIHRKKFATDREMEEIIRECVG